MRRRLRTDQTIFLLTAAAGAPGAIATLLLLAASDLSTGARWTVAAAVLLIPLALAGIVRSRFARPGQILANVLAAMRVGDFSIRAREARHDDPMGLAMAEANALADRMRLARLGGVEAGALLRAILAEIDVVIVAIDDEARIQFVNRAAERLFARPGESLLGVPAGEIGLGDLVIDQAPATIDRDFPGGHGRWDVRIGHFRQDGVPHRLLVLSDVSRALRQEEREAWQRLVRVLSHEINNSLTPIRSIAGSLLDLLKRDPPPDDREDDLAQGLAVISNRSAALVRFMNAYVRLARLPSPAKRPMSVGEWVRRVARLESGDHVVLREGPAITIDADPDQLDQALINLLRNGMEASDGEPVEVGWAATREELEVWVADRGAGVSGTRNLFVPFFTTKPGGSGIGLVLARQIAEAHGGSITLENRNDGEGAVARITLPRDGAERR